MDLHGCCSVVADRRRDSRVPSTGGTMNIPNNGEMWLAVAMLALLLMGVFYGLGLVVVDQLRKWWGGK